MGGDIKAEDQSDLYCQIDKPTDEDKGMDVHNQRCGRRLAEKSRKIEAKARDHADPDHRQPDGVCLAVVSCCELRYTA